MNILTHRVQIGDLIRVIVRNTTEYGGVSLTHLSATLGVDPATTKRWIARLRSEYDAPIIGNQNGYAWRPSPLAEDETYALALRSVFCRQSVKKLTRFECPKKEDFWSI